MANRPSKSDSTSIEKPIFKAKETPAQYERRLIDNANFAQDVSPEDIEKIDGILAEREALKAEVVRWKNIPVATATDLANRDDRLADATRRLSIVERELQESRDDFNANEIARKNETRDVRRARLYARRDELRCARVKGFIKQIAKEEGLSKSRVKQLIAEHALQKKRRKLD